MLTHLELKSLLHYNLETGIFTWKISNGRRAVAGNIAGYVTSQGYIKIRINKKPYLSHRLAWLYIYGEFPLKHIDHINGIRNDNRINNLRESSPTQNMQNLRKAKINSTTGLIGAMPSNGKFCSRIRVNGNRMHLGMYKTAEEAHQAYIRAKRKLHEYCEI